MQKKNRITHDQVVDYLMRQKHEMQLREFLGLPEDFVFDDDNSSQEDLSDYQIGVRDAALATARKMIRYKKRCFTDDDIADITSLTVADIRSLRDYEQGREEGERAFSLLVNMLVKDNRFEDIRRIADDPRCAADLYKTYGISYDRNI